MEDTLNYPKPSFVLEATETKASATLAAGIAGLMIIAGTFFAPQVLGSPNSTSANSAPTSQSGYRYFVFYGEPPMTTDISCQASIGGGNQRFIFLLQESPPDPITMTYGLEPFPVNTTAVYLANSTVPAQTPGTTSDGFCLRAGYQGPSGSVSSASLLLYTCCTRGSILLAADLYDLGNATDSSHPWLFTNPDLIASSQSTELTQSNSSGDCSASVPISLPLTPSEGSMIKTGDVLGLQFKLNASAPQGDLTICEGVWGNQTSGTSIYFTVS